MLDSRDDLRATEESIHQDADQVKRLEEEKAALDPADPRVGDLSEQVEQVTAGLRDKAAVERELSTETQADDGA
jgi:hypothetical protein